ncbi:Oidioi.mRNA.OKI2018_I69.PAR.g11989.t1.cds [Oikopleura dioica]|uniref:DNA sliding clamp PCNA n=1 Tax=Oikopleura dioica TaxID=34765 RepID=A0ABN7RYA5_OIKDI|nr:Oidioi.mRNA.OKI2018_I69.PAR.g11989.t1.cds [Oikopleura dioica]
MSDMVSFLSTCTDASSSEDDDSSSDDDPFGDKESNDSSLPKKPATFSTSSPKLSPLRSNIQDEKSGTLFGADLSPIRGERNLPEFIPTEVQEPRPANSLHISDDAAADVIDPKTTSAKDDIGLMDELGDFDDDPDNSLYPTNKRKSLGKKATAKKLPCNSQEKSKTTSQHMKTNRGKNNNCTGSQLGQKHTKNPRDNVVANSQELLSTPQNSPPSSPYNSRVPSRSPSPTTSRARNKGQEVKRKPPKSRDVAMTVQVKKTAKPLKPSQNISQGDGSPNLEELGRPSRHLNDQIDFLMDNIRPHDGYTGASQADKNNDSDSGEEDSITSNYFFVETPAPIHGIPEADKFIDPNSELKRGVQYRDPGDEPKIKIPLKTKRSVIHSYISGNGNPGCIVEYLLPLDDDDSQALHDQPSTSTAPTSATPWTCSIPNGKREILKQNKARQSIQSAPKRKKVVYHMQYNGANPRGDGAASVHLKCQNCNGRQTFYCDASFIMPTKSGKSWMMNPEKIQLFWHNATLEPPRDHQRLSQQYEHVCRGLNRRKIAEITFSTGIIKLVDQMGPTVSAKTVRDHVQTVQETYPEWSPDYSMTSYIKKMRNRKRFYRKQMRKEFESRDEKVPLVPKILGTLNYHKRLSGEGLNRLRWPVAVTAKFLIVADLLMLSRIPPASFIRMMLDGTFTIAGDFRQCITIQIAITDDLGFTEYKLVAAVYLLSKKKVDYAAAFYTFWAALMKLHDSSLITTVFAQTDGEMSLFLGAEEGLKRHSVNVLSTICSTHLERALYRNLKSIIGFRCVPAAVRIFTFMMKSIQLVRPDLIMPSLLGLYALVQRLPKYGKRISRFLRDYCQRVMVIYRDRFCYHKLLLLAKEERSSVCLSTNPAESLNNSLNSRFRDTFKRRKGSFDEDLLLMYQFMDECGREYNNGDIDKEREDENNVAADREAYIQKVFDRCDKEEIYERGMPFPKEFFMDFVHIALERFAEKAPARHTAILRKRWARNRLAARLTEIENGKVKAAEMDPETEEDRAADQELEEDRIPCDVPVGEMEDEIIGDDFDDEDYDGMELNDNRPIGELNLPNSVQTEMAIGDFLKKTRAASGAAVPGENSDAVNALRDDEANQTQGPGNNTENSGAEEHTANMEMEQLNQTIAETTENSGALEHSANMETDQVNRTPAIEDELHMLDFKNPFESESDSDIETPPSTDVEDAMDEGEKSEEDSIDWGFENNDETTCRPPQKASTSQAFQHTSDQGKESSEGVQESKHALNYGRNRAVKFATEAQPSKCHVEEFQERQDQTLKNAGLTRKRKSCQPARIHEREDNKENKKKQIRMENNPTMATLKGKDKESQLRDFDRQVKCLGDAMIDVNPTMLTDAALNQWPDKPLKPKEQRRHERAEEKALEGIPKVPGTEIMDDWKSLERAAAETAFSPIRTRSRSKEEKLKSKKDDSMMSANESKSLPADGDTAPQRRMYKIVFTKAELMKCVTDALVPLLPWAIFDLTPDGICVQSVDGCQNILVQLVLRAAAMEEYSIDKPYALGVKVELLAKYLKNASNDDKLTITGDDENGKLVMKFKSPLKDVLFQRANMGNKHRKKEKLIFDSASITMPSCVFEQTIKKLSGVGEVAKINVTNGKAVLSSKGDIGEVETELDEKDNDDPKNKLFSVEAEGPIELNYSCKYLEMMSRAACLAEQVTMQLEDGVPMTITYNMKAGYNYAFFF